jgi:hypothetical protein
VRHTVIITVVAVIGRETTLAVGSQIVAVVAIVGTVIGSGLRRHVLIRRGHG